MKPIKTRPREGWDNAFRLMYEKKDDTLLPDGTVDDAMENWEWK
ncbi:MAG: transcriptional regulator [Candidatus Brocadia sinica]|nr:MAG: transcriptional regulator [Candidatus Brocadia sinica]